MLIPTHQTRERERSIRLDPQQRERLVRQLLADRVSSTLTGLWLLIPEHLRLGTWDLLRGWSASSSNPFEPHLALQVLHEAALCSTGIRRRCRLAHRGFEIANGLPAVASDLAIHNMLNTHTVEEARTLQRALGKIRRASGHFRGQLLAIDPHRLISYSQRQMVCLKSNDQHLAQKVAQTFFCLDAQTGQPICFTTGSSSRTAADAAIDLLPLAADILQPPPRHCLVLADTEHYARELFDFVSRQTPFDLFVPMPNQRCYSQQLPKIPSSAFHSHWVGFATACRPFAFKDDPDLPLTQYIQRLGEPPDSCSFKAFLATAPRDELLTLSEHYPQRWHIEEFFHDHQQLGWKRAGTLNLNIRYGQMTLALMAQTALSQLRQRLGPPWKNLTASQFSQKFLQALDGDIRVQRDTIVVTFYNAPDSPRWRQQFQNLPTLLERENVSPAIPWLFNFKLDFRFK